LNVHQYYVIRLLLKKSQRFFTISGEVEHDLEADEAESGIGDRDGLAEQTCSWIEPSLGWTVDIDQTVAMQRSSLP